MLTTEEMQKQHTLEVYDAVVALYSTLRATPGAVRVKHTEYHDGVPAEPLDFCLDVEIKTKRAVGLYYYEMFMRLALIQETGLLPEDIKVYLGTAFSEYGLGVDGAYARLYYQTKNEQVRNHMKEAINGSFRADTQFGHDICA